MSPALLLAVLSLTCSQLVLSSSAVSPEQGPGCEGRCGELFSRGRRCSCDINCLAHDECCKDFEAVCTSGESCRGRCGEFFRRGRLCECDPDCVRFNTCCLDYQHHCDVTTPPPAALQRSPENKKNDPRALGDAAAGLPQSISSPPPAPPPGSACSENDTRHRDPSSSSSSSPSSPSSSSSSGGPLHTLVIPPPGRSGSSPLAQAPPPTQAQAPGAGGPHPSGPDAAGGTPDLCDNRPINGLAVLNNGSLLVFKGNFYWLVDPSTGPQPRTPGPPRSIADDLGLPSPIDAAFTRCNCQGKTYIIRGDQYWRLENGAVEPGYPQPLSSGFGGLTAGVSAALPVPAARKRPEAVYFFNKGGKMQKFSYPTGSSPSCSRGSKPSARRSRSPARQAEGELGLEVNVQVSLRGLPSGVSCALSAPNPKTSDGYDHFLFSGPQIFNVKISGDLPSLVKPAGRGVAGATGQPKNSVSGWLKCP